MLIWLKLHKKKVENTSRKKYIITAEQMSVKLHIMQHGQNVTAPIRR